MPPLLYETWFTTPQTFGFFFPLYVKGPIDILQQAMYWELYIKLHCIV